MPIHDWSRVSAGTFHAFHLAWIAELQSALNSGGSPSGYYAMAEQILGPFGPEVVTLQANQPPRPDSSNGSRTSSCVAVSPPRTRIVAHSEMDDYVRKRRTLVIRHGSEDRIVALLEIVSPGNKSSRHALRSFVQKATEALYLGFHLLIVDLFPCGPRDPQGIHGAVWAEMEDESYVQPPDKPLTLAAYSAGPVKTAYVEPIAVGDSLPAMPLFLEPEEYVETPLESTYVSAFRGLPQRWRDVLEASE